MDKLAVIQSAETIAELEKIDKQLTTLVDNFKKFIGVVNEVNTALSSGTPKEYVKGLKDSEAMAKRMIEIEKKLIELKIQVDALDQKAIRTSRETSRAKEAAAKATKAEEQATQASNRTKQQEEAIRKRNEKAMRDESSAYKRLMTDINNAKNKARDFSAELVFLAQKAKRGEITQKEYNAQLRILTNDFKKAQKEARDLANEYNKINGVQSKAGSGFLRSATSFAAGLGIYMGASELANKILQLAKSFYEVSIQLDSLHLAQKIVFKTNDEVAKQNIFLTQIAERYGLKIMDLTDSFTKFTASAQGTNMEGKRTQELFESVSKTAAVLGISADDTKGVFKALEQMMSKGKIQAEELRGQLGDRMAGAFRLFADAMGLSTIELDKLLKKGGVISDDVLPKISQKLNEKYVLDIEDNIDTKQANLNRLSNVWVAFVDSVENRSGIVGKGLGLVSDGIVNILKLLTPNNNVTFIQKEQNELNALVIQLRQNWNEENKRKKIIQEIIELNPNFLYGLDKEKLVLSDIESRLKGVNEQYAKKVIMQTYEDDLSKLLEKQKDNYVGIASVIRENGTAISGFSESSRKLIDDLVNGNHNFAYTVGLADKLHNSGKITSKEFIKLKKILSSVAEYTQGEGALFNDGLYSNIKAISELSEKMNSEINIIDNLINKKGVLINWNDKLSKSYNTAGEAVVNAAKEMQNAFKQAEAEGKKYALVNNIWREKNEKTGKWKTTGKRQYKNENIADNKQSYNWHEENNKLKQRTNINLGDDEKNKKPKEYRGSRLNGYQKDYLKDLEATRDEALAIVKKQFLDGEISEKEHIQKSLKINVDYYDKKIAYLKKGNAEERKQVAKAKLDKREAELKANDESFKIDDNAAKKKYDQIKYQLEREEKLINENDYLSAELQLNALIENNQKKLDEVQKYYDERIKIAKEHNKGQEVLDLEDQRQKDVTNLQDTGFNLLNSRASKQIEEIEYTAKLVGLQKSRTFEEQKQAILADKRLKASEREYLLQKLSYEQKKKENEDEIEKLEKEIKLLEIKGTVPGVKGLVLGQKEGSEYNEKKLRKSQLETENNEIDFSNKDAELEKFKKDFAEVISFVDSGLRDLGLNNFADHIAKNFDDLFTKIKEGTLSWKDVAVAAVALVADAFTSMINTRKEQEIAALDEQLKNSQASTEQEIGFINERLGMLNSLQNATKEQIQERNALEDEARVLKEQQLQREKMIATRKARAEQKAAAQQALVNGLLAATMALATQSPPASYIMAAISAAMGIAMAASIMSKNPVPQYFVGTSNAREGWALTQERGAELITDKEGNIKTWGDNKGSQLTYMNKGDKVFTALETQAIKRNILDGTIPTDELMMNAARKNIIPIISLPEDNIDYDLLSQKIGERFDKVMEKYDKVNIFEEDGIVYKQIGGNYPVAIGRSNGKTIVVKERRSYRDFRD